MKKILALAVILISLGVGYGFSPRLPQAHEISTPESIEARRKYEEARSMPAYIPTFNPYMLAKPKKEKTNE